MPGLMFQVTSGNSFTSRCKNRPLEWVALKVRVSKSSSKNRLLVAKLVRFLLSVVPHFTGPSYLEQLPKPTGKAKQYAFSAVLLVLLCFLL